VKIFGWSDGKGGVFHYRIREPLRGLKLLGHETATGAALPNPEDYDVVVVRALHDRWGSLGWLSPQLDHALRVYDLDDDLWAWHPSTAAYRTWTDERLARAERNIVAADLVTTTNERLAAILSQLNPNVAMLPNTIPERLLHLRNRSYSKAFVVGWQGAVQHISDLQLIYAPLFRFMLRHRNVELHLWGPENFQELPRGLAERVRCFGWQESVWGYYYSLDMHVGLAPLDMLDPFNQTKSDIRVREYAALGIPVLASNGVTYSDSIRNGENGFLIRREQEWEETLEFLYSRPDTRQKISDAARRKAREWTTEANARKWEETYERARERKAEGRTAAAGSGRR